MTSAVLIATIHETFAAVATRQLKLRGHRVETVAVGEAMRTFRIENEGPDVVLVDCDANLADGASFYDVLRAKLAAYQILLICTEDQALRAGQLALSGEVFDYLPTTAVKDPNRVPLAVDRAWAAVGKKNGDNRLGHQQILQSVAELRQTLKSKDPIVLKKMLDKYEFFDESRRDGAEASGDFTQGSDHYLLEIICGRLRRIENQILLLDKGLPGAERSMRKRILIVEDDDVSAELLESILRNHGFEAIVASSAATAKHAIAERRPDLVLMDVHLGDANGIKLAEMMRTDRACRNVPVILVTSDRQRKTVSRALNVDVQGYVLKPYEPEYLVRKIRAVLESAPTSRTAAPHQPAP